jgi:hypothetical protein
VVESIVPLELDEDTPARPLVGRRRWLAMAPFAGIALVGFWLAMAAPSHRVGAVWLAGGTLAVIVLAAVGLPWARWPAAWQAAPVLAYLLVAVLLEYAAGAYGDFFFLTALPIIWLVLFHGRRELYLGLVLQAVVLVGALVVIPGYPTQRIDTTMTIVLSCFGGLAGQHLVSRTRRFAADASAASRRARADHDLLEAYLAHAGLLVVVLNRHGEVVLFNRSIEELTGYRPEEVLGRAVWDAMRRPETTRARFAEVLATGGPIRYEDHLTAATGERRLVVWTATTLVDDAGEVSYVIGIGVDVTEQRRTQRLFANVLAAPTEQMIAATDIDATFTVFNVGAERLLGYSADELIGRHTVELIHVPEELQAAAQEAGFDTPAEMFRHTPPAALVVTREWTLVRKDGSHVPVMMTVNTMLDRGEPIGYVLVARDITADRAAAAAKEQALQHERQAADRLRELDEVKSDFVATVSHDLRTPLTSIVGNTELLLDGDAGELGGLQHRLLESVDRNARRLNTLVGDLLMLSRIESGTLRMQSRDVSVREVVDGTLEAVAGQRAADVALDVELPAEPVLVRGDPDQLERVIINLVSNALKFTPPGGRVGITVAEAPEQVRLSVSDTGIGIPEAELPHIFDRFFRSSRSQQKRRPGSGLGLTIAKSIVEQHGGSIEAGANPTGGTTFSVTLPRLVTDPSEPAPA